MKKVSFIILIIAMLATSISSVAASDQVLVLYAFSAEGELLAKQMTIDKTEKVLGRTVHIGKLSGKDIILAESGVGMTNAAMTTQKMIDLYHPKEIIFSGIAGAIDSTVHIGDIVICRKWLTHDYGYYGAKGFEPKEIEVYFGGKSMIEFYPEPPKDSLIGMQFFPADPILFVIATQMNTMTLDFDSIGSRVPRLIEGEVGVSGNSFIDNVEKRLWLSSSFHALVTDMESASVAQVSTVNGIPFIIFRSASDLAGGSGSESAVPQMNQFFKVAASNSAKVVMEYLKELK